MTAWLDKYISRLDSGLWLNIRDLKLYKAVSLKYIGEISYIKYEMKNYIITKPSTRLKMIV